MSDTAATAARLWPHWSEPSTIDVEGLPTAYRRAGSGAPVLLLHGVGFTRQWLPLHEQLAGIADLVAPDLPGFGDTPLPESFEDFSDYVLHLDALLDRLELDGVHLVGHGLGARLAAHLAAVYPRRFASLTLIAPSGLRVDGVKLVDVFRFSPEAARTAQFNGREIAHTDTFELQGFPDDILVGYTESAAHALLTWTNRFDARLERRLGRIAAPSLVIAPEEDRYGGPGAAERFAELIPHAHLEIVPGPDGGPSSYALPIEQPAEVVSLIARQLGADSTQKG